MVPTDTDTNIYLVDNLRRGFSSLNFVDSSQSYCQSVLVVRNLNSQNTYLFTVARWMNDCLRHREVITDAVLEGEQ